MQNKFINKIYLNKRGHTYVGYWDIKLRRIADSLVTLGIKYFIIDPSGRIYLQSNDFLELMEFNTSNISIPIFVTADEL